MTSSASEKRALRAGIIGLGVGQAHARGYLSCADARLTALCDVDEQRLGDLAAKWGIEETYTDYREMLRRSRLDVVSVCVPNALHAEVAMAALEAGVDVICEKPLATTVDSARRMVQVAQEQGHQLMMTYNYRYRADSRWMQQMVQNRNLGEIYHVYVSWRRETGIPGWGVFGSREMSGGGALIDLGVHVLDLALWMMDFPAVLTASAVTRNHFGPRGLKTWGRKPVAVSPSDFDVEDGGLAFLRLANGASLIVDVSWAEHIEPQEDSWRVELRGTKGTIVLQVRNYRNEDTLRFYTEVEGEPVTVVPSVRSTGPQSHEALIHDLVRTLMQSKTPDCTGEQGLLGVEIVDAIYRSSALGREVLLNLS